MLLKNFACGRVFSFLYVNFVHDLIHYLYANCDKCCKQNFACGGLSSLLYFNFVYNFINYLCATVTVFVKKNPPRWVSCNFFFIFVIFLFICFLLFLQIFF